MQYGLSFLPDCTGKGKSAKVYFQEALKLSTMADKAGLHYIKMTEHYLHPYGGYCPSPLSFLTAVATLTKQIRLLTGCILPSFHHPIQIAAETAMVDAISQGRLEVGFARAYLPYEFHAFEVDIDKSRERYTETIRSVLQLWTEDNVSQNNRFYQFSGLNSYPKCTQDPHPPIWGAAVNSRQSFAYLAENLFSLLVTPPLGDQEGFKEKIDMYRSIFTSVASEKNSSAKPKILMSIPLIITSDARQIPSLTERYLGHYLSVWTDAARSLLKNTSKDYPHYAKVFHVLNTLTPNQMVQGNKALIGTPEMIIDKIEEIKETYPIDGIIWQIDFGEQPFNISKTTLQLFIEVVHKGNFSFAKRELE
jgi:alkanesulfonate monooxygenase SsuD/methylene tetrahydromethanopterin reductase-like flavin-dependent oxidoreductase (luciferase family)